MTKDTALAWARRPGFWITVALISGGVVGFGLNRWKAVGEEKKLLDTAGITILRTPGGLLEVSRLVKNEEFAWKTNAECPFIDCSELLEATVTEVRVPVHYVYRIPLAETWMLKKKGDVYQLSVPKVQAGDPPAVDLGAMAMKTSRGWFSPSAKRNEEALFKQMGPALKKRSAQSSYIDAQQVEATKTVREFASKWMAEQKGGATVAPNKIEVTFGSGGQSSASSQAQSQ